MLRVFNKKGYKAIKSSNNDYIKLILKDGWEEITEDKPKKVKKTVKKSVKKTVKKTK